MSDFNIVVAHFGHHNRVVMTDTLYQYDYGQQLKIEGITALPQTFQAHFSNVQHGGVSITVTGINGMVDVPNSLLMTGKRIYCWIYVTETGSGETVYQILMPVQSRPMPEYYDVEDVGVFDSVVNQVAEYAATATTGATSATASATAAAGSEVAAAASASAAADSAENAVASEANAEASASAAQASDASAATAATTATSKAAEAAQSATSAGSAADRAEAAQEAAETAQDAAETAATSATADAATATTKATAAAASATTASTKATDATNAATTATAQAVAAEAAKTTAVEAKTAAQSAQSAAETAATNATAKATEAAASATAAAQAAASINTPDSALSDTSTNPVQNKVVTAEFADVKSAITQHEKSVGVYGEVEFSVTSGNTHSSNKDKIYCAIKTGEQFYFTMTKSGSASVICTIRGWMFDGTGENIQNYQVDGTRTLITALHDYVAISVYINPISETKTYRILVEGINSILQSVNDLNSDILTTNKIVDNVVDVLGVYGKSSFTVPANTSHSSTLNNVTVYITNGTTFYVTIEKSETPALNGTLFVHKSDGNVNVGAIAIDGKRHAFTAPADITWVGLYLNPINYQQSYKMLVEMESSIYHDIATAGTELEDTTKRENVFKNSNVNFLFFTDVHGSSKNVEKIIDYANTYHSNLNFVVNGGDTVAQYLDDGISWYDSIVSDSDVDVLYCIGNHDCWGSSLYDKLPATTIYNSFIAPVISSVDDIVQPGDASTDGKCYYYKDYNNVRVIVLNAMSGIESVTYWNADAKSWLESVLADAKTNSKHVLCINHAPFVQTGRVLDNDSQWTSFKPYFDATTLEEEAVSAVEAFIADGGIFIAWLVGHTHNDAIMTNATNMLMIACATAHYADGYFHSDGWGSADDSNATYDCFNVCGIDTTNKILKIDRVGWCMDSAMKKRSAFSYDYQNRTILCDRG